MELSAYGRKILQNREHLKKLGMITSIREYTKLGQKRLSYAVGWFGETIIKLHPRLDLKIYKQEAQ